MRGWFDGIYGQRIPIIRIKFFDESSAIVRYKIQLLVEAYDLESAGLVFPRLKVGETEPTDDQKIMKTSVYVKDKVAFKECLKWKEKETTSIWASMTVDQVESLLRKFTVA